MAAIPTAYAQNTLSLRAEEPAAVSVPASEEETAPGTALVTCETAFAAQPDFLGETAIIQAQQDVAAEHISFDRKEPAPTGQTLASQTAAGQPAQDQKAPANRPLLFSSAAQTEETKGEVQKTTAASSSQKTTLKADDYSQSYMGSVYYQRLKAVTLTGNYRSDLLAVAESQLGYRESPKNSQLDGSGSGSGDYTEYGRFCGTNGTAWCSEFATWCARQANIPISVLGNSTSARADRFGGTYYPWSDTVYAGGSFRPRPGDLVFFAWSESSLTAAAKDHTAILVSTDWNSDSLVIYTLDGNSGGQVQRNTRKVQNQGTGKISGGWIAGFIAPNYGDGDGMVQGTVTAPPPAKPVTPAVTEPAAPAEESVEDAVNVPEEDAEKQPSDTPDGIANEQPAGSPVEGSEEDAEEKSPDAPDDIANEQPQETLDETSDNQPEESASNTPVEEIAAEEILGEDAQTT